MDPFFRWLANSRIVLLLLGITLLFSAYLFPVFSQRVHFVDDPDVVDLQMSFTKARFIEIVDTWISHQGIEAVSAFRKTLLVLDIAFPIIYALLLSSLYAWLAVRAGESESGFQRLAFSLPYAAGLMDLIENSIHFSLLSQVQQPADLAELSGGAIFTASIFACIKFILISLSILVSLLTASRLLVRFLRRR